MLTRNEIAIGVAIDVAAVGAVDARQLDQFVDQVQTEPAVVVEEDVSLLYGQVWVGREVPDVLQVLIVNHDERVSRWREWHQAKIITMQNKHRRSKCFKLLTVN